MTDGTKKTGWRERLGALKDRAVDMLDDLVGSAVGIDLKAERAEGKKLVEEVQKFVEGYQRQRVAEGYQGVTETRQKTTEKYREITESVRVGASKPLAHAEASHNEKVPSQVPKDGAKAAATQR